jgi:hypothetical protein
MSLRPWIAVAGLAACSGKEEGETSAPPAPPVVPGAPMAGVAESVLELPIGTPLGGFTSRCTCLGNQSRVDDRQSAYNVAFVESVGEQTLPSLDAIWLENGDDTLVILKTDTIYPFDHLLQVVAERLSEETGEDLTHKVVHTTSHTHHSFGAFSDAIGFYLGTDRYNEEIFQRFAEQMVTTALAARATLQPVKIGMGWSDTWDAAGAVYHDRRDSNDALAVNDPWGVPLPTGRDPHLGILRIDTLDDEPLAMMVNFGMHGIILDTDSPMVSSDAGGGVEEVVEDTFDHPVMVMFTQGAGGDASPGGIQDNYARIEALGELAAPDIRGLFDAIPTSDQPIRLETFGWNIPQDRDHAHIDRNGTVDYSYAPYVEGRLDDGVVQNPDGTLDMPLDEFNTQYGAAFCGTGDLDLPVGGIPTSATFPYTNCMEVEFLSALIKVYFQLEDDEFPLPVPHLAKAAAAATRIGPISTLRADGTTGDDEEIIGFLPGEPTAMYTEMFRRRIEGQYGLPHAMVVGYSQDEEGYQLLPEDWLTGGYEPDISVWGPLAAETVQETLINGVGTILMDDVHQDADPSGIYDWTVYPQHPMPTLAPDLTPDAGTRLTAPVENMFTPIDIALDLAIPAEVPRVQGMVQLAWEGGDPAVDLPHVTIQRLEGTDWVTLTTHAGRVIDTASHDVLLVWTPAPLYPIAGEQTHAWWAAWQPVSHAVDRTGLPTGTYRLHVEGKRYTGGNTTWPWNTEAYSLDSPEFEVVPAVLDVAVAEGGLSVSIPARADGYRLIHMEGADRGDNPIAGPVAVTFTTPAGDQRIDDVPATTDAGRSFLAVAVPVDATAIRVEDVFGNAGTLTP